MKKILISILPLFILGSISNTLFAQGIIMGEVIDSLTSKSLPGANVYIPGTSLGAAADVEGIFRIPEVAAGLHTVEVSFIGYRSATKTVIVNDGETSVVLVSETGCSQCNWTQWETVE